MSLFLPYILVSDTVFLEVKFMTLLAPISQTFIFVFFYSSNSSFYKLIPLTFALPCHHLQTYQLTVNTFELWMLSAEFVAMIKS